MMRRRATRGNKGKDEKVKWMEMVDSDNLAPAIKVPCSTLTVTLAEKNTTHLFFEYADLTIDTNQLLIVYKSKKRVGGSENLLKSTPL